MKDIKRAMIDLETLALNVPKPDAVIWEIGITFWKPDGYISEYRLFPDVLSQIMMGRKVDPETVKWWMAQKNCPKSGMIGLTNSVRDVLDDIQKIFVAERPEEVWGNGPQFDLMLLHSLGADYGFSMPWNHKMERDVRTISKTFGTADDIDVTKVTSHNSLEDNRDQIFHVMSILRRMEMYEAAATMQDSVKGAVAAPPDKFPNQNKGVAL